MHYSTARDRPAPAAPMTVAHRVAQMLSELGIREAWGICGREIVPLWTALQATEGIATRHARHENGAGFAALGSWAVTGAPVAVFSTTGPGVTNTITSLEAARAAGAKVVFLSPLTPAAERDRLGIQATGPAGYSNPDIYSAGRLFDLVTQLESPEQLPVLASRLAAGLAGPGGFAAHIAIPTQLQAQATDVAPVVPAHRRSAPGLAPRVADAVVDLLAQEPFAVWLGWGARAHATAVRMLLDVTGAPAFCSPRALGIADAHPGFLGVTGNGGTESLPAQLADLGVRRTLVLGTRMDEATSSWAPELAPPGGFVHVDLDPTVFGQAYPEVPTFGVQAGIGEALEAILARASRLPHRALPPTLPAAAAVPFATSRRGVVHPVALMRAIQRELVDATDMPIVADASSAMFWGARHLRFATPGRWLVENAWGSMGIAGAAVLGAAAGRGGPAAALCGDGSMHMQDEINTAVRYGLRAIWIVMNDDGLGIVRSGMRANGRLVHDADYPPTDFAAVARAKGADAVRVTSTRQLGPALRQARAATGPFLVDVAIDPTVAPPLGARGRR